MGLIKSSKSGGGIKSVQNGMTRVKANDPAYVYGRFTVDVKISPVNLSKSFLILEQYMVTVENSPKPTTTYVVSGSLNASSFTVFLTNTTDCYVLWQVVEFL